MPVNRFSDPRSNKYGLVNLDKCMPVKFDSSKANTIVYKSINVCYVT